MTLFSLGPPRALQNIKIDRARIPGHRGLQQVWIDAQGDLQRIQPMAQGDRPADPNALDLGGDWLSLGGVDLQINGALGCAFSDLGPGDGQRLQDICQFLWCQGIDGFLPTIVTTTTKDVHRALAAVAQFERPPQPPAAAEILGVHLEGPFLNPSKRGAHPTESLQPLSVTAVQRVLGAYGAQVKVMTLAPELDPSGAAIAYLHNHHIIVSLGHSLATAAQAQAAFDRGATMVTHAFNAMPGLHHRQPGLLAAALLHPRVWCGVIADGHHVDPLMLQVLLRACPRRVFLVSDALAPLGLSDGLYPWDRRHIKVQAGTARLADHTLAGTTLSLLVGVENLVRWGACSVGRAIALATEVPRQALGCSGIGPGQPASALLRWRYDPHTKKLNWQRLEAILGSPQG